MKKHLGLLTVLAVIALTVFFYFRFFFVFGEGVKSGELNYVVYKGVLFKTYEGKLIQTGIRSKEAGSILSSSMVSRKAASSGVSPSSMRPPGRDTSPVWLFRRAERFSKST